MSSSGTIIEPLYVVDTHALIWYLSNDKKLGARAARVFEAAERGEALLIVSAIVVAELYYANKKNGWFKDFKAMYEQLSASPYFRLVPVEADHVLDFDQDEAVPEMHDRMIAGLARRLHAPLLAADQQIAASGVTSVIW